MALLGHIINRSLRLRKRISINLGTPRAYQINVLKHLLNKASKSNFGKYYQFKSILSENDFYDAFAKKVPFHNYNQMYNQWWRYCQEGESNVCWPGKVKYFALSSGTSESASKHIPVTDDMIKSVKKAGFKQFFSMQNFDLPADVFGKGILMLGGSTSLYEKGDYYEGDMSGISAKKMPRWLSFLFYKPGQSISKRPRWEDRIKLIVRKAPTWNVGTICGVPSWVQIVMEEIIRYHKLDSIHDIWPNLALYIHGGVSIEPYREQFKTLFGNNIKYIETYMASEGSFGFQARPNTSGIKLILNNGIFYEFVPFNLTNFTEDGEIKQGSKAYLINEVVEKTDYAIVISTCAGAWRYLIGDVIRFTNVKLGEFVIVGRTKQFLSLCGEHLSVDNMNKAIDEVQRKLKITIKEFTVAGYTHDKKFAHKWYIGCDQEVDKNEVLKQIDETLRKINDDYHNRKGFYIAPFVYRSTTLFYFYRILHATGKFGAMNKFPSTKMVNKTVGRFLNQFGNKSLEVKINL
ncbi:MAG: GH3 auxin-responsive promoter family protein [Chitinophagaceae bacterium]